VEFDLGGAFNFEFFLSLLYHFAWFAAFMPFVNFAAFPSSR
jgi:hypothetical protein